MEQIRPGTLRLSDAEAHHLRDVLRMNVGTDVELFDDGGATAAASIVSCDDAGVCVRVDEVHAAEIANTGMELVLASAVPKANRADWMIEKLAELGVDAFIPLAAERSVVLPEGKNKLDRWRRLSIEASKQSHRRGVMRIDELTAVPDVLTRVKLDEQPAWCLSTEPDFKGVPLTDALKRFSSQTVLSKTLTVFVGPEGGWTKAEIQMFLNAGVLPVRLTDSILRIETAALALAAVIRCQPHQTSP